MKYLHELISFGFTEKFFDAQTAADMRVWLNTRLKSLRSQPHKVSIKDATKFGNLEYERGVKDGLNHHWKPSEVQMEALKNCAYGIRQNGDGPALRELYNDLKKL